MSEALLHAIDLAQTAAAAKHHRPIVNAIHEFVALLGDVPNSAVSEWSHERLEQLRDFSEEVVDVIERHLAEHPAAEDSQRELAGQIYEIRRRLEEIDRWERHYLK